MRRFFLGTALLAALLLFCLFVNMGANKAIIPISHTLEEAAKQCMAGDFAQGQALANQAKQAWDSIWKYTAVFADHTPMDEIDGLFAQIEIFSEENQTSDLAACCAQLSRLVYAVAEAHRPAWWNIF